MAWMVGRHDHKFFMLNKEKAIGWAGMIGEAKDRVVDADFEVLVTSFGAGDEVVVTC